ncbi:MAG: hypothetical protein AAB390_03475, partial [Patescibacteria group bacterium]
SCVVGECVDSHCKYSPKNCDDGNLCTTESCSSEDYYGCSYDGKDCDDGTACTNDSCDPAPGSCVHELTSDFCIPCTVGGGQCPTSNRCVGNASVNYNGSCEYGRCFYAYPQVCSGYKCHDSWCDPESGICLDKPKDCDDGSVCTSDSCDYEWGTCQNAESYYCNDWNPCTTDSCDPALGCVNEWDWTSCQWGPGSMACADFGGYWNCMPCDNSKDCDDGLDQTGDQCYKVGVGFDDPSLCVHEVPAPFYGVGFMNFYETTLWFDYESTNGSASTFTTSPVPVDSGQGLFSVGATKIVIYGIIPKDTESVGYEAAIACVDKYGYLRVPEVVGDDLVCHSD